jgi:hypothetical protein
MARVSNPPTHAIAVTTSAHHWQEATQHAHSTCHSLTAAAVRQGHEQQQLATAHAPVSVIAPGH